MADSPIHRHSSTEEDDESSYAKHDNDDASRPASPKRHDENGERDQPDEEESEANTKSTPWSFRKKLIVFSSIGLVVIIGAIVALAWWLVARQYESTDDAFVDAHWEKVGPQVAGP